MNVSKNFVLEEFVDPAIFKARGDKAIELLDPKIITIAQAMRDFFKVPVTINDWHTGGQYHESGLRTFTTTTGALYSQHKYGRAVDLKLQGLDPEHVRGEIRRYWDWFVRSGLTTIEQDTPSWVHVDCRYTGLTRLYEVPFK